MNTITSAALMIAGLVLLVMGISAMDSFSSDMSRFFTGSPTDKSVWMVLAGVVVLIAGGSGAIFRSRSPRA